MEFEWDAKKNDSNIKKHGISFEEAKDVFDDMNSFTEQTNKKDELRFKKTGLILKKLFTVIYTIRGKIIRIISARRANKLEEKKYNDKNK